LPAALQGFDIDEMLAGAAACDAVTRSKSFSENPAAQLAAMWHHAGGGHGHKDMVILPYKDRLELFSRYLQQLIMESLGKERDLDGKVVNQGITVYGNKGSTDQHAYVQQLREGANNFFVTFVRVLNDSEEPPMEVEEGVTSGDFLDCFYLGTRKALYDNQRESITINIINTTEFYIGLLMALFERAVGYYSSLINVNAYHQPGVEAGKKAASGIIRLQPVIVTFLNKNSELRHSVQEITDGIEATGSQEEVFQICLHLSANPHRGIEKTGSGSLETIRFQAV